MAQYANSEQLDQASTVWLLLFLRVQQLANSRILELVPCVYADRQVIDLINCFLVAVRRRIVTVVLADQVSAVWPVTRAVVWLVCFGLVGV